MSRIGRNEGERERGFWAEGTASAKALRWERAQHLGSTVRRLVCSEQRERGEGVEGEGG